MSFFSWCFKTHLPSTIWSFSQKSGHWGLSHSLCVLSSKRETAELTIAGNLDYKEYTNLCVSDLEDLRKLPWYNNLEQLFKKYSRKQWLWWWWQSYKQCVAADCTPLSCIQLSVDEFIQNDWNDVWRAKTIHSKVIKGNENNTQQGCQRHI